MADYLKLDTLARNKRSTIGGVRRLHQSQNRQKHLRLRDDF